MNLSTPTVLYFNGRVVPWEQATVHVWSETAIRGTNVFEGIRAYRIDNNNCWRVVALDLHLNRLLQSARLLRIPHDLTVDLLKMAISDLLSAIASQGEAGRSDLYIRPTLYIENGSYGYRPENTKVGHYIVAFPTPRTLAPPMPRYCVSTYKRGDDLSIVPRAKAGAGYLNFRLARIEADERGFDDAILLNSAGNVAETGGACLLIRRGRTLVSPLTTDGTLESITRTHLLGLARAKTQLDVVERSVHRSELYIADEIIACGTLLEVASVRQVDHHILPEMSDMADVLFSFYRKEILSGESSVASWLTDYDIDKRAFV